MWLQSVPPLQLGSRRARNSLFQNMSVGSSLVLSLRSQQKQLLLASHRRALFCCCRKAAAIQTGLTWRKDTISRGRDREREREKCMYIFIYIHPVCRERETGNGVEVSYRSGMQANIDSLKGSWSPLEIWDRSSVAGQIYANFLHGFCMRSPWEGEGVPTRIDTRGLCLVEICDS